MIIDFHTHAFPDFLAAKALNTLSSNSGYIPITDGTIQGLILKMDEYGIDRSVICNIATNAKQTINVNKFAQETNKTYGSRISALCSVHPENEEALTILCDAKKIGFCGVKIHPDFMGYDFINPIFDPILDLCQSLDMFMVIHAGFDHISPNHFHCTPQMIIKRHKEFPKLKIIAAHYGSNRLYKDVLDYLIGEEIYFDTSLTIESGIPLEIAQKMILSHNSSLILFGSDSPWSNPKENIQFLEKMKLPSKLLDDIFYKNALNLLKI